ncbi:ABC transporter ATP-binding protein [Bosea caraganae]|uniref:ABC transporter ATP-binding protein n=1 Tax=Bosea caraganae TaxID=2763117 RepID=A0A370L2W9_9HYPH|nr:ABC transporter ATP-binding protein [Bosea caraganae]RDJ22420.1 ABC transporter ATP-binding protein [Bosea caraganae]RDJ30379.1 ABC transporter ATP-binding protein [Bosea caraganae]
MGAALRIEGLSKAFAPGRPAIDDLSLTVEDGEIAVLLGPSGCGKTSTLRCVAGLEQPDAGRIAIGGNEVVSASGGVFVPPQRRELGMVFQSYAIWPHLDVRENVAYPLRRRGVSRRERAERVDAVLDLVGLRNFADRSVATLSGGQAQRVALARSLVYEPRLLLLDEPLSNLDVALRLRLRDELRRIIKRTGLTALFVTHDQSEAIALADRIAVMRDGRLLQFATPTELYNRPVDGFVAEFTGAGNLLPATLLTAEERKGVALIAGKRLPVELARPARSGTAVTIVIRPENLRLRPAGTERLDRAALPGRILSRRYQGAQTSYSVEIDGLVLEAVEAGSLPRFVEGDAVEVLLPREPAWALPSAASIGVPPGIAPQLELQTSDAA